MVYYRLGTMNIAVYNLIFLAAWLVNSTSFATGTCQILGERSSQEDEIVFEVPQMSIIGFTLKAKNVEVPEKIRNHVSVRSIDKVWNLSEFSKSRFPPVIGSVSAKAEFSKQRGVRVLDMPIKLPGTEVKLPKELEQFREVIQKVIDFEVSVNPNFDQYNAYITIDQGVVKTGMSQRRPGLHVDGFQGNERPTKSEIDHSYIVTDSVPTVFYDQPFHVKHLDPGKHNFFKEFDRQAAESSARSIDPFQIYLIDSYAVHRASIAETDTQRTFFRITFSKEIYDREGLTDNPLLEYNWQRKPKPFPALTRYQPKLSDQRYQRIALTGDGIHTFDAIGWARALGLETTQQFSGGNYFAEINRALAVAAEIHINLDFVNPYLANGNLTTQLEPATGRLPYELYLAKKYFRSKIIWHSTDGSEMPHGWFPERW